MRDQPRNHRAWPEAGAGQRQRPGDRRRAGAGISITGGVRANRYLAAAGLGTRRDVERLITTGRVLVNGVAAQLDTRVNPGDAVLLDNKPLRVTIPVAVVVHKPAGEPVSVPHPAELVLVKPLKRREAGIELMLSDPALARRIGDPRFPVDERWAHAGLRTRFAGIELGTLAPGEWRPLNRKEQQRLRRGVRLPPRP